jgi:hypothetical protein
MVRRSIVFRAQRTAIPIFLQTNESNAATANPAGAPNIAASKKFARIGNCLDAKRSISMHNIFILNFP